MVPQTVSDAVGSNTAPAAASTRRASTCRNRSSTVTCGEAPESASSSTSVCCSAGSPVPATAYACGTTTPNCQRTRFLLDDAVYG